MTIEDEILQYLHYHPLSNRVEITLGITNPPSGRIVKRLLVDAVNQRNDRSTLTIVVPLYYKQHCNCSLPQQMHLL